MGSRCAGGPGATSSSSPSSAYLTLLEAAELAKTPADRGMSSCSPDFMLKLARARMRMFGMVDG